ncbi:hypothetical protein SALBM311S_03903 [Streptomyces alboniger]
MAGTGVPRGRVVEGVRAYGLIAGLWIRSTMAYRTSFALTTLGNFAMTALDFVAILLMFSRVGALGGYTLAEVAFLYGLSGVCLRSRRPLDRLHGAAGAPGARRHAGHLAGRVLRQVLAQVAADRFALRRLGRVTRGLLVLGYALVVVASTGRRGSCC